MVLLVRHGQASFGADDYDVLSSAGRGQAETLGRYLSSSAAPVKVISGSLRRQTGTAEAMIASAGWGLPVDIDERWDEFDHLRVLDIYTATATDPGPINARSLDRRAFQALFEKATGRWASANHDQEYPETFTEFTRRIRGALAEACREAGTGSSVVVVSSGGVIAAAAAMLVDVHAESHDLADAWQRFNTVMVNSSVTRVVVGSTGARLLSFNEHTHLAPGEATYR